MTHQVGVEGLVVNEGAGEGVPLEALLPWGHLSDLSRDEIVIRY